MKARRYKRDGDISFALGMTLAIEMALAIPERAEAVYLSSAASDSESLEYLRQLCAKSSTPIETNDRAINILSPKGNCYAIGAFRKFERDLGGGRHVVLVNPSDSGNLGTIIRTAVGFGFNDIAVIKPAADDFDPKTVRASMGAIFHVNCVCYGSFDEYMTAHASKPRRLYAFAIGKDSVPIRDVEFVSPFSLIFGPEASGLPEDFSAKTNALPVIIPQTSAVDSLNLTIAAGVAMFVASSI